MCVCILLVVLLGTLVCYFMPNPVYTHIYTPNEQFVSNIFKRACSYLFHHPHVVP